MTAVVIRKAYASVHKYKWFYSCVQLHCPCCPNGVDGTVSSRSVLIHLGIGVGWGLFPSNATKELLKCLIHLDHEFKIRFPTHACYLVVMIYWTLWSCSFMEEKHLGHQWKQRPRIRGLFSIFYETNVFGIQSDAADTRRGVITWEHSLKAAYFWAEHLRQTYLSRW